MLRDECRPSLVLLPTAMLTGLAGAWFLHRMLVWLPSNGTYLGYIGADVFVPSKRGIGSVQQPKLWLSWRLWEQH